MNNIKTGETIILHDSIDLLKFLINRIDCFALQHKDGGYRTERTAIRNLMFSSHLSGNITIGAYQFNQDNQVKWVCADIDSHGEDSGKCKRFVHSFFRQGRFQCGNQPFLRRHISSASFGYLIGLFGYMARRSDP